MAVFGMGRRKNSGDAPDLELEDAVPSLQPSVSDDEGFPRFLTPGGELLRSADAIGRSKVRDAFTPSQPVQERRMFAGRTDILRTLIRAIEDMRLHVIIYGDRGLGKTSLLHLLTLQAREAHYHVAYYSCSERGSFNETFRAIASEVPLLFDSRYGPTSEESESGTTLAKLLPEGEYSVSQLSDVFSHLSNTRLIVVLDEFDRSPAGAFRQNVAEFIKNVSDRALRVQLVIAGVGGNLAELVEHIPSIRRNILGLQVPPMTPEEVRQVIAIGEEISGLTFTPQANDKVVLLSNGSPYLASLLAQHAGFLAVDEGVQQVEADHVLQASMLVASELRERLPGKVIASVDAALADGLQPLLLALGQVAMGSMGRIDSAIMTRENFEEVTEYIQRYPDLIEFIPDEGNSRFRFVEEGLPSYLWITLSQMTKA